MKNSFTRLKIKAIVGIIALLLVFNNSGYSQCKFLNENFDINPVLSPTNVDGRWYPDRYQPSNFTGDVGRLKISINAADGAQLRPSSYSAAFYNTQGRKINQCGSCITIVKGDIYIPADWATKHRRTDMWGVTFDATNAVADYPIIGFANVNGASPTLRYWDGSIGDWVNIPGITYDTWITISATVLAGNITYAVNGISVGTFASPSSIYLGEIIMQAYNFNDNTLGANYDATPDNSYDAFWDNLFTTGPGGNVVTNTTTSETFCTIQAAVNAANTLNGHTIEVGSGTYNEQVFVNKELSIKGVGTIKPIINFMGTPALASAKLTAFEIVMPNVTIDNFDFNIDISKIGSAIVASAANVSNLTITNNAIFPYRSSTSTVSFGKRNAVNINYGEYRINSSNPINLVVNDNAILFNKGTDLAAFTTDDAAFRSGVAIDEGTGTLNGNTIQTISQDIEARFTNTSNDLIITNNNINGGGVNFAAPNNSGGNLQINNNIFDGTLSNTYSSSLRVKDNIGANAKPTTIMNNVFNNHNWGISIENYSNLIVDNNTFTPIANSTAFRHITLNTKELNSSSATVVQTAVDGIFTKNTLNGSGVDGGKGIVLLNHDSDNDSYGTFTIGTPSNENTFAANVATFIELDGSTGPSSPSAFPENELGAGAITTMACWDQNLNIVNNKFEVGMGLQLPQDMNMAERATLETKLTHDPDNACLGLLTYYVVPQLSATLNATVGDANNDGVADQFTFSVENTPSNIIFGTFTDQNGTSDPLLKVFQSYTITNATVPFCNNCSAAMTAFNGATGTAQLVDPGMPGTLTISFQSWIDSDNNGAIDPAELKSDAVVYTVTITDNSSSVVSGSIFNDDGVAPALDGSAFTGTAYLSVIKDGAIVETLAISGGAYTFSALPAGTYNVVIHKTPAGSLVPQIPTGYNAFKGEGIAGTDGDENANGIVQFVVSNYTTTFTPGARIMAATDLSFSMQLGPLPVKLIAFDAKFTDQGNELTWKTSSESNFSHYEVQKSADASVFKMIGKVVGVKNTVEMSSYIFLDQSNSITDSYYRLKMVDLDGKFDFSNIRFVKSEKAKSIVGQFYPNPSVGNDSKIDITTINKGNWLLTSYDMKGSILSVENRMLEKGLNTVNIDFKNQSPGVYFIKLQSNESNDIRKLLK